MKSFIVAIWLLTATTPALAQNLKPPSFPASILEAQFPIFKGNADSLADLRRYRQELEFFRAQSLEGYNRALQKHLFQVKRFDAELEKSHATGQITTEEYNSLHQAIADELEKSAPSGEYMDLYRNYLAKYKSQRDWVLPEITTVEKSRLKF